MNKALIAIVAIAIVVGGYLVFANQNETDNGTTPNPPPPPASPTPQPTPQPTPPPASNNDALTGEVTINYTSSGYSPSTVRIRRGTEVTFVNQTNGTMWPASGPHPTHTDYPEFDPKKAVSAGQSYSFTFDKTGTWRFHDHLNPTRSGTITVVQ
jgi:plastocyanin